MQNLVQKFIAAKKVIQIQNQILKASKFVIDRAKQARAVIDKSGIDKAKRKHRRNLYRRTLRRFGPNGSMLIVDTLTSMSTVQRLMSSSLVKTAGTWALQVRFHTSDNKGARLQVMMPMQSLSNCLKQMWMWMM